MSQIQSVPLHEAARYRYLNYAMSVITSRALPDVRDGLKPVQRRILYAMYHNLKLYPDARYRKSAAVIGEVMAKYHPHGDSSIYDAMVRMAQPFSLLHTLIDGQGNFGSMDGDGAAAMRYTEAKLRPISMELLTELKQRTVDYRPNYDGQHFEPIVLPAQLPNLLINGSEGIAVGMSTKIPPHNLRECIDACVALIDKPELSALELAKYVKGPDFPTGGLILTERDVIKNIYATGHGSIRIRGCWELEKDGRKNNIIITEIPYAENKASLVEKIGLLIVNRKLPQITDVRDESTDKVRIVVSLKVRQGSSVEREMQMAMAYICRHTSLQVNIPINLTCLVPTDNPEVPTPIKANLQQILRHWLDFRLETVRKRFIYELEKLKERIHILEAFAKVFDVLDEIIALIRASEGRRDAHEQIMERFGFDDVQTEAILDLRLYKLAKLEILAIREELDEKMQAAAKIEAILSSVQNLWGVVRSELLELRKLYGQPRRSKIGGQEMELSMADQSEYIIDEDTFVIATQDGWIKRQGRFKSIDKIRVREGDKALWISKARTKNTVAFFTTTGGVYVMRIADIMSTTGYGEPLQKHFSFKDGEKLVGAIALDQRSLPSIESCVEAEDEDYPPPYGIAVTKLGRCIRFSLKSQNDVTNKNGRRYMKPNGPDDEVIAVFPSQGNEWVSLATQKGRALCFPVSEITLVRGAGKGVIAIKLDKTDGVIGFELTKKKYQGIVVTTSQGRELTVTPNRFERKRAAKGSVVLKRGTLGGWSKPTLRYDKLFKIDPDLDSEEDTLNEESVDEASTITTERQTSTLSDPSQTDALIEKENQEAIQQSPIVVKEEVDHIERIESPSPKASVDDDSFIEEETPPVFDTADESKPKKRPRIIVARDTEEDSDTEETEDSKSDASQFPDVKPGQSGMLFNIFNTSFTDEEE